MNFKKKNSQTFLEFLTQHRNPTKCVFKLSFAGFRKFELSSVETAEHVGSFCLSWMYFKVESAAIYWPNQLNNLKYD